MATYNNLKAWSDMQAVSYNGSGKLTFESEGQEGGRYYSRYLHVPGESSGLTLGRGYDMKEKTANTIKSDLVSVGVESTKAELLSKAHGLSGQGAEKFITDNRLNDFSITPAQQNALFKLSYAEALGDVHRISTKDDVLAKYGSTDFRTLHPVIQDVLVDLRYRGDYSGATRTTLQPAIVKNDLVAFRNAVSNLKKVPEDRQSRRLRALDNAIATLPKPARRPLLVGK